ncbi:hypothetical protein RIR_jg28767.t1 [Rhizophagus irregularis DAOM 181602=DAOM 197198]|nr:hypothetical protein RIR_jg28767.t1 [Rhizophagus irregularis DAOM 181602=DAOM 197198]
MIYPDLLNGLGLGLQNDLDGLNFEKDACLELNFGLAIKVRDALPDLDFIKVTPFLTWISAWAIKVTPSWTLILAWVIKVTPFLTWILAWAIKVTPFLTWISAWAIKVSWGGRRLPKFGFHKGDALPGPGFQLGLLKRRPPRFEFYKGDALPGPGFQLGLLK